MAGGSQVRQILQSYVRCYNESHAHHARIARPVGVSTLTAKLILIRRRRADSG
jgi:hypothetical protein